MEKVTTNGAGEVRTVKRDNGGLALRQVMLVAMLLAAGAVLKFFVGSLFAVGMKPNFIIAMYCLAILLTRPNFKDSAAIGLLAGAICQFFPGTPYLNFASELAGALAMSAILRLLPRGRLLPAAATFITTVVSGGVFMALLYGLFFAGGSAAPAPLAVFGAIIAGTATVNAVIVQLLYIPVSAALRIRSEAK